MLPEDKEIKCFISNNLNGRIETTKHHEVTDYEVFNKWDFGTSKNGALKIFATSIDKQQKCFKCSECDHSFSQNGNLKRHVDSVHKKEKRFICNECNHLFSDNSNLKKHIIALHNQEKQFVCHGRINISFIFLKTKESDILKIMNAISQLFHAMSIVLCFLKVKS